MFRKVIINPNKTISEYDVEHTIYFIHRKKVILDRDLAKLYGVQTKVLNQTVQRNIQDFLKILCFR